jgi:hypothetical protein
MIPARTVVVVPGPAYRPAAYRPPPLRLSGRELGEGEVKFNWDNLGQTILLTTVGAGALYGSGLLPDPLKTVALVGGVGVLGYAAYTFLGNGRSGKDEVPPGTAAPIAPPQDFAGIVGKFQQPKEDSTIGFNWFSDHYDVRVMVSNPNPKPVTVTFELIANEYPKIFYAIPLGSYEGYLADSKTVVLPPGNTVLDFNPAIKMSRWLGGGGKLNMELTLRKVRIAGEFVPIDHVSFSLLG